MDAKQITEALMKHIIEELLDGDDSDLDENTPLLALGIIDSLATAGLLMFIEQKLGVPVPDNEVSPRNFMSVAVLRDMILRVQEASKA